MNAGRGITALIGSAVVLGCAVLAASGSAEPSSGGTATKEKKPLIFKKAKVVSDGQLTPGTVETATISNLPANAIVEAAIEPPPTTPQCGELYFCDFVRIFPADGSPRWRSDGHGRATLSFVMPSTYVVELDPFGKKKTTATFMEGQAVHLDVRCKKRTAKKRFLGIGFGRAAVKLQSQAP